MLELLEKISNIYKREDAEVLVKAYYYARDAHKGQKRASGEEYFTHPCAVAEILISLGMDYTTVASAFLHDVIEDTPATEDDIRREFGEEILTLVNGVTKLDKIEFKSQEEEQAENFKKIFVSMAKDIRVIIIKLADRLHNMRSLNFLSKERQLRMARETLEIYAPLAGRLGISQIKCELEDLCLKYIDAAAYEFLSENIHAKLEERKVFVNSVVKELRVVLDESNIKGEVVGRPKHFYSIYKKMKGGKELEQIYDLTAVRVIVQTVDECYEILGKIHKKWKPIPGRIKDYIAMPKPNMYQSLHTTVVTSFGKIFEIQIRTYAMHRTAEFGIAAHWKYKENSEAENTAFDHRLDWIREVMEWQGDLTDGTEFLQSLKGDIYASECLVFTPNGEVLSLPTDSTPIDFAFRIHTEVGNRCVGAKVNGKMVPLSSTLETGDVVEIITSKNSKGPSWDWLKIVKSTGAKAKIKAFYKRQMAEEKIKIGKSMLEAEAKNRGYSFSSLLNPVSFATIAAKMSFSTHEEMFAAVGCGAVSVGQIIYKLIDLCKPETEEVINPNETNRVIYTHKQSSGGVIIKGMEGLLVRFAGCCNPVPGDEIVGFVSRGRGVCIHRADCPNMRNEDPERLLEAKWSGKEGSYTTSIKITATENAPLLSIVSSVCKQLGLFVMSINGRIDNKARVAIVDMTIKLNKKGDLDELLTRLKSEHDVIDVFRTVI
ncbi:MAG: bifunctional (p)ppGpp synthetase/guanosine-3',5'-bis(diphosphate) 3'-pyrophosphohydrolase [Clostridia bacterium]|nr:bifunctional (p)ppGpp synthetase/guanosine-3',5'-bis(diphosphate) 3'-pyrophosphohydrolase [Clostridia bacterium]